MIFHFDIVRIDRDGWRQVPWSLPAMKTIYRELDRSVGSDGWNAVFLGNHDNPRAVSHFGDDSAEFRVASAKALATMMFTQRGTPFVYQGEELGMTNVVFDDLDQFDDVEVKGLRKDLVATGKVQADELLRHLNRTGRDHARTPMQWSAAANGGFTTAAKPWFLVNPNYPTTHAEQALADPDSIYHHYRKLIALRRSSDPLLYGAYTDLDPDHPSVFAYTRSLGDETVLVVVHFGSDPVSYALPVSLRPGTLLLGNFGAPTFGDDGRLSLRPWEALVFAAAESASPG
jgi:oligo-1,6-glucosidase